MKIGIDISQIVYEGTGVARFTKGLTDAICAYDTENDWVFFFSGFRRTLDEEIKDKIQKKGFQLIEWHLPPTFLSFLWNNLHIFSPPFSKLDWFISSDWAELPLLNIKKATVVHDLTYLRYPETVDEKIRKTQEKRLKWVKKESRLIFADSQTTAHDLTELLQIEKKRIVVNYPGVDITKPSNNQIKKTLQKYNLPDKNFILAVGKLEPRKNLERLASAFQKLDRKDTIELVIVGPTGWNIDNLKLKIKNLKLLGYVSDEELYSLYSSCMFFVFPSLWEGFGYPIIEAMKLGAPVTCSNTSSILEVADDAALLFEPRDINEMIQRMNELIRDEKLRNDLIQKGLERSRFFTWKRYYNTLITSLYDYRR